MTMHQVAAYCRPLTWGGLIILAGCAVGPNFHAPPPPALDAYRKDALPPATASANVPTGDAQRFLEAADVPERWWTQFASDELDRRVEQALAHSPSVASAQTALRQAQQNANAARGALFPSVDAKAGATRGNVTEFIGSPTGTGGANGTPLPGGASTFTLYNAGVNVGYTLDLFGGVRRGVEAQSALADLQREASLELVRFQYRNGAANYLQVLDATRQYQQARIGLIQARAARPADTAALYVALGGGWREDDARKVASVPPAGE